MIIQTKNISKAYRIGLKDVVHENFVSAITSWIKYPTKNLQKLRSLSRIDPNQNSDDLVWAVKDVSFDVNEGQVLGIIGKNGAGKSTLLKIIAGITEPTLGRIEIYGRIASLLEVGTGFNPELTGRENVFLNGTILGMTRKEIEKKFDEIVDFSGVEKFIDTPIKRYSSGMKVRLAFAVAAFLEPEILIIDEVLAVGDAEFQRKCLGKMNDVTSKEGRTVLFVSHNMAAVKSLCNHAIVLENGNKVFEGNTEDAVHYYQKSSLTSENNIEYDFNSAPGNENIRVKSFTVHPLNGKILDVDSGVKFTMEFYNFKEGKNIDATFELLTIDEIIVFHSGILLTTQKDSKKGLYKVEGIIPEFFLNAGSYKFNLIFGENQRVLLYKHLGIISFDIENTNSNLGSNMSRLPGILRPKLKWDFEFIGS